GIRPDFLLIASTTPPVAPGNVTNACRTDRLKKRRRLLPPSGRTVVTTTLRREPPMKETRTGSIAGEGLATPPMATVHVPLPLLDVLTETRTAFFGLCLDAGQQVLRTMMEQDREQLCGPKHVPNSARRAVRGGSTRGEVTLGGRRIRVPRLRARSVDGHELELPSFLYAAGRDPLDARTLQAIAIGITTRKYHRTLDPLPTGTRKRAVSKSSVSRHFVALTSAQLTTWLARPLADLEVRSVFLDGLHFRDHVILLRAGRGFPGPEARPRPARGDDRERDRLQGPAGRPARPGGSTASAQCSSSSTAGPVSARHCARRVAPPRSSSGVRSTSA